MSGIKKESWRETQVSVKSGVRTEVFFSDTQPNIVQVVNTSKTQNLYVMTNSSVSDEIFELSIIPEGRKVLVKPLGLKYIYLYSLGNIDVLVNSGEGDVYPNDLQQETDVIISSNISTNIEVVKINQALPVGANVIGKVDVNSLPVGVNNIGKVDVNSLPVENYKAEKIVLSAGIEFTVKNTSGYVTGIKTVLTDLIVRNGSLDVWENGEVFGVPVYFDTNIKLVSVTGGTVYIIWK